MLLLTPLETLLAFVVGLAIGLLLLCLILILLSMYLDWLERQTDDDPEDPS